MTVPFALSAHAFIKSVGADAGFASIIGLALLVLLYFAQTRETTTLRDRLEEASDRVGHLENRVAHVARAQSAHLVPVAPPPNVSLQPTGSALASLRRTIASATPGFAGGAGTPAGAPAGLAAPALLSATRLIPVAEPPLVAPDPVPEVVPSTGPATEQADAPEALPAAPEAMPAAPEAISDAPEAIPDAPAVLPDAPVVVPDDAPLEMPDAEPIAVPAIAPFAVAAAAGAGAPSPLTPTVAEAAPPAQESVLVPPSTVAGGNVPPATTAGNGRRSDSFVGDETPFAAPEIKPRAGARTPPVLPKRSTPRRRRPPPGRPPVARRIVLAVIGAGVVAVAVAVVLTDSGGGTTPAESPTHHDHASTPRHQRAKVTAPPAGPVTVAVLNGTGIYHLASDVRTKLLPHGFEANRTANAAIQTQTSTVVGYLPGHQADAERIAKALGLSPAAVQPADQSALSYCAADVGGTDPHTPTKTCPDDVVVTVGTDLASLAQNTATG